MDNKIFVVNFFVSIIPAGIIANWFYYKNNRFIVAAILLRTMLNAAAVLIAAGQVVKGGNRCGAHHRRTPSLRERAAQLPLGAITLLCPRPATRRFGAILFLPPRLQAEADRGNDAKVWSCLSRRRLLIAGSLSWKAEATSAVKSEALPAMVRKFSLIEKAACGGWGKYCPPGYT